MECCAEMNVVQGRNVTRNTTKVEDAEGLQTSRK